MSKRMFFGGKGGTVSPVDSIGGRDFYVFGGEDIDGIQIGSEKYGKTDSEELARGVVPQNGVIRILEVQTHANKYWGYLKLLFGDQVIEAGQKKKGEVVFSFEENDPLPVKISSINAGTRIDGIEFILV